MKKKTNLNLVDLFRQIDSDLQSKFTTFSQGETIFSPGDLARQVYFSLSGVVKLSKVDKTGEEITLALLPESSIFGVLPLITGLHADRFYHAVAFTPVKLFPTSIDQLEQALHCSPELSMLTLQRLSERILQGERMVEILARRSQSSRLASFLLILCRDFGVQTASGIMIDLKISHQAIAEVIGSARVTVTRLLGILRQEQVISISPEKKITIHNPTTLNRAISQSRFKSDFVGASNQFIIKCNTSRMVNSSQSNEPGMKQSEQHSLRLPSIIG